MTDKTDDTLWCVKRPDGRFVCGIISRKKSAAMAVAESFSAARGGVHTVVRVRLVEVPEDE